MSIGRYVTGSLTRLLSGSAVSQLIMVGSAPVLTRLYEPTAFGQYGMLSVAVSFAVVFSTAKYDMAVLLPKSNEDAWALVCLASANSAIVAGLLVAVGILSRLFGVATDLWQVVGATGAYDYMRVIALSGAVVLLTGSQSALMVWMNRLAQYGAISTARVAQALATVGAQLLLAVALGGGGVVGLLFGAFFGLAVCVSVQGYFICFGPIAPRRPTFSTIRRLAREHRNLPLHMIPTDLVGAVLAQLPVFFLGSRFSEATVGYYMLAQRALLAPMQLIAGSIGEVFRATASAQFAAEGECAAYFYRVALLLSIVSVVVATSVMLFGPDLFSLVFGSKWRTAGEYASILIVVFSFKFVVSPLSFMFIIAGKTKVDLLLHVVFLCVFVVAFSVAGRGNMSIAASLWLFVAVYSLMYALYFFLSMRFARGAL